ncbi:MAG: hypothetical protein V7607_5816 [Solirubrobacteraceae bacterium]
MRKPAVTRGTAFGLNIEADFSIPGLPPRGGELPIATLVLADDAELARAWHPAQERATRISEEHVGREEPDRFIDADPETGYRLFARYFGSCLVSRDGARLLCVPPPVASWRWQRFLVGRCLPLAAMLRGYEVIHAGAVEIDGGVVAVVGPSGAGKSSLTVHLVLQGASFFTDDVLVLEESEGQLVAHPGFGVVNVRAAEDERLGDPHRVALGAHLGKTGRYKHHYALTPAVGTRPLRALYLLSAGPGNAESAIVRVPAPEPLRLLASAFIHDVRPPEQLARLLDVCARLAASVAIFDVALGQDEDAAALAARLRAHVQAGVGAHA